jgi:tRNA-binding protein
VSGYHPPALATVDELLTLDLRVGTIVGAEVLRGARTPTFALKVDFGTLGTRDSSAEITELYEASDLVGLQVIAVVNLPSRRVAGLEAGAVVLSVNTGRGERVLVIPERPVPDGGRVG